MDTKVEKLTVDGRRAEVHTTEKSVDGSTQRIVEHYEEIIPLEKKRRVVEKVAPVVIERVVEHFNGNNVTRTTEKVHGEDLRLTDLKPANPALTAADMESIIRKVLTEPQPVVSEVKMTAQQPAVFQQPATPPFWSEWFNKSATQDPNSNPIISYTLITLLAIEVGFVVWQLFIR